MAFLMSLTMEEGGEKRVETPTMPAATYAILRHDMGGTVSIH